MQSENEDTEAVSEEPLKKQKLESTGTADILIATAEKESREESNSAARTVEDTPPSAEKTDDATPKVSASTPVDSGPASAEETEEPAAEVAEKVTDESTDMETEEPSPINEKVCVFSGLNLSSVEFLLVEPRYNAIRGTEAGNVR